MIGRFFKPDEKIFLIFSNEYYDQLREISNFAQSFPDKGEFYSSRDELVYPDMP